MDVKEPNDTEISLLFDEARDKLDNIEKQAKEKKKQIVVELSKSLEGKIPTDAISMEIVIQLRDIVSASFIRQCLEEKYKQKVRVDNAKKQQKGQQQGGNKVIDKLATLPTLNQEEEEAEKQNAVIIDVDGRVSLEKDEDESITDNSSTMTDKTFAKSTHQSQQEQYQQLKKQIKPNELKECSSCKELYSENLELKDALGKSDRFVSADKMASTSPYDNGKDTTNDILNFEFPLLFRDIRNYMAPLLLKIGDLGNVWFSGKINQKTGKVISANLGRLNQQQDDSIDIANRDDL